MSFRIRGLSADPFAPLYGLSDDALARHGAERVVADAPARFPDRITMRDAVPGATLLLLNHTHLPGATPYRACHAIYVLEGATERFDAIDTIPEVMAHRLLSLRGFDGRDRIAGARVVPGAEAAPAIEALLADPAIRYIHAHNAGHGCYAGLIERA